ncbi:hypothetical protein TTHERM_01093630 (macronuclear) [Tetrahymena thermophila SB210]|uniref:Uncharacterized protein n=1 Tax=Tetrahymena thermophila (strain SB210) TaxID=312017 RepID=Q22BN2_TETTS|nr:hypothetical protein TTHERM_01093630 [Tetrahymena thermophila SB210]EAR82697.2 hypothetical protein TTHERM_01093630 [Tetrahymena thermophila SB210]|eukprot:XP_001030360.2 hypothetical protein TTHERM_01093630 [Tetrahymena thermophila SB210]
MMNLSNSSSKNVKLQNNILQNSIIKNGNNEASKNDLDADQSLDPSKIGEYIQLLQDYEKNCLKEQNFKEAELVTKRIEELQQHELVYRSLAVVEKNKEEINELEQLNLQQFNEFNEIWDQIIDEHVQKLKQLEENMVQQHQQEIIVKEQELQQIQPGKCKYSKEILNLRFVLENLIKCKKYGEAHEVKERLAKLEKQEEEKWVKVHEQKIEKKREQIVLKQKQEMEALQVRLENSLQEKIKIRTLELEKLLQKFQNMKNELEVKQNQELSKLQVMNNKTMSKLASKGSIMGSNYINTLNGSRINS